MLKQVVCQGPVRRQKLQQQTNSYEEPVTQVVGGTKAQKETQRGDTDSKYRKQPPLPPLGEAKGKLGLSESRSQYLTCNT